ncbi:MAG: tetratricopeptide repeat protein [Micrococcaceae bacterium]
MSTIKTPSYLFDVTDAQAQQLVDLSKKVPVVIDLWAAWCAPCRKLGPLLEKAVTEHDGDIALVKIDVDSNYGAAQAFRAQSIPTVVGLVDGRPVELFTGAIPKAHVDQYLTELLKLAKQNNVTGKLELDDTADSPFDAAANPLVIEAAAAVNSKDYDKARTLYQQLLDSDPTDTGAKQGIAQANLLERVNKFDAQQVRNKAAQSTDDINTQLDVADLDMAGGHVQDAFNRLVDIVGMTQGEDQQAARERLLEYFDVVGVNDSRVAQARQALARSIF